MRSLMLVREAGERRISRPMERSTEPSASNDAADVELDAGYRLLSEEAGYLRRDTLGAVEVSGPDAIEFLQGQLTNDLEGLEQGACLYAALLDRKAHIVADCRVLLIDPERLLLVAEVPAAQALAKHLETYRIGRNVEVADRSDDNAVISVIGPATRSFLEAPSVGREDSHVGISVDGIDCTALGTPEGADLICNSGDRARLLSALNAKGLVEVPEAAAEILRVEAGRPRFGLELDQSVMPAEVGIVERAIDFEKGCYLGQEPVARLHYKGRPNRLLRGLKLSSPVERGDLISGQGRELGKISTACVSPALGPIALAVIRREAEPGATVVLGDDDVSAEVVELPMRKKEDLH